MKKNRCLAYTGLLTALVMGLCIISSCRKTEYEQLKRPYNDIQRFATAGYGDLDSINAVISGDSILVYWNADVAKPVKIKPAITVSKGAAISPASGQEVDFSEATVYTVTAEDGTKRTFKLKPVLNVAIPVLFSMPVGYRWAQTTPLLIQGEYFFSAGDASKIKVYAQRLKDGFEFDLPFDIGQTTTTQISARLPVMTADLDTGAHRIYVKVGSFASNSMDVNLIRPSIFNDRLLVSSVTIAEPAQPLKLGDSLIVALNIKGMTPDVFEKFYPGSNIATLWLYMENPAGQGTNVEVSSADYIVSGNQIKVRLGNSLKQVGYFVRSITMRRNSGGGESGTEYTYEVLGSEKMRIHNEQGVIPNDNFETGGSSILQFVQQGQSLRVGQELRLNYSFSNNDMKDRYAGKLSQVELIFRDIRAGASGGRYNPVIMTRTDQGTHATFSIPSSRQSTLTNNALAGIRVKFTSADNPAKYLYSSMTFTELNTLFVRD